MHGLVRTITHWTAGGGRASDEDRKHYHRIVEYDGTVVPGNETIEDNIVTSDGDYAAHTLHLNTGSIGVAMAGMRGAVEEPFSAGPSPINETQFDAHCQMLADLHRAYGIPVTRQTCLTHAEVQPTLGVIQRGKWDITRLPWNPTIRGALPVGDHMRERVLAWMGERTPDPRPPLRIGMNGVFVTDLQVQLKRAGFFPGAFDGVFGERTRAAVLAFQAYAGLITDGTVGPQTWAALARAEPPPERDVTIDDLRMRGSRTIDAADDSDTVLRTGTGAIIGVTTLDTVIEALDKAQVAVGKAGAVSEAVLSNWPMLLVAGIGAAIFVYGPRFTARIREARAEDARTGANMAR